MYEECQMCGERIRVDRFGCPVSQSDDVGEFWVEETQDSVWGHASCGFERGYSIA